MGCLLSRSPTRSVGWQSRKPRPRLSRDRRHSFPGTTNRATRAMQSKERQTSRGMASQGKKRASPAAPLSTPRRVSRRLIDDKRRSLEAAFEIVGTTTSVDSCIELLPHGEPTDPNGLESSLGSGRSSHANRWDRPGQESPRGEENSRRYSKDSAGTGGIRSTD